MIDNLVLEDRGAQLLLRLRVLLDELEELAFLTRELTRLHHHRLGEFLIGNLNFGLLANLGQKQAQANAALGQLLVLVGRLDRAMFVAMIVRVFLVVKLMRDLAGLGLDQHVRQIELHQPVELVQQGALHHRAAGALVFGFQTLGDLLFQLVQRFGTEALGQLVVDLGIDRLLDRLDGGREDGILAGKGGMAVIGRELHLHFDLVAGLGAGQLILETGDEAARAQNQRVILGGAAFEQLAIDRALEVDHNLIVLCGLGALALVLIGFRVLGQIFQRLGDGGVLGLHDQAFQLQLGEVHFRDFRQDFIGNVDDDIVALFPVLAILHLDLRLHGRAVAGFLQMLAQGAVDGILHGVAHHAGAELLFQHRHRHLALAEALHLDFGLGFFQLLIDHGGQIGRREGHLVAALEAVVLGLFDLHVLSFVMVRVEGLEPPRLAAPEPKSGASTNFATPAMSSSGHQGPPRKSAPF